MRKTYILILLTICSLLTTPYLVSAFAEHDYFDGTDRGVWEVSPNVCFKVPKDYKFYTLRAIDSWRWVWQDYIGNKELNFKIYDISKFNDVKCHISLFQGNPTKIGAGPNAIGATSCYILNNFIKNCIIYIQIPHPDNYGTTIHEIGHSLGLGHRQPYNIYGMLAVLNENDIMFPVQNDFQKITDDDILALKYYYGIDGFKNPPKVFIPSNYTTIHD